MLKKLIQKHGPVLFYSLRISYPGLAPILISLFFLVGSAPVYLSSPGRAEEEAKTTAIILEETDNLQISHQNGKISIIPKLGFRPEIKDAGCAVLLNNRWIYSYDYPSVSIKRKSISVAGLPATELILNYSKLSGQPDLIWNIRIRPGGQEIILQVKVINHSQESDYLLGGFTIISARKSISGGELLWESSDCFRVLSESVINTADIDHTIFLSPENRTINSSWIQLITPMDERGYFLTACLKAERFLTKVRTVLRETGKKNSTTMDLEVVNGGVFTRSKDKPVLLNLPLLPGEEIESEPILINWGDRWIDGLEKYGRIYQILNDISIQDSAPMGYCTWTSHYWEVSEKKCLVDAWELSRIFKPFGYDFFQLDGLSWPNYRGDYLDTNRFLFPSGVKWLGNQITWMGLTFGLWVGPGEVSEKSKLFRHHPDWLVGDNCGRLLSGRMVPALMENSYILDMSNPEVMKFLKETFRNLYHKFYCRYFKLDFLNIAAREGNRFRSDFTGIESLRAGLKAIQTALGPSSFTTAAGAPTWAVAGLVNACRAGPDISHDWEDIKTAADAIATRFYLHRRFFILDPDAMVVTPSNPTNKIPGRKETPRPLSLDEARVSTTVAVLTGGVLQLGDSPMDLSQYPERLALVTNPELIKINRKGKIARPVDLMDFLSESDIPAFWHIHENNDSEILAIFNWGDTPENFTLSPEKIGILPDHDYLLTDLWSGKTHNVRWRGSIESGRLAPHSVRIWRISRSKK